MAEIIFPPEFDALDNMLFHWMLVIAALLMTLIIFSYKEHAFRNGMRRIAAKRLARQDNTK